MRFIARVRAVNMPAAGYTARAPFKADTSYFDPSAKEFMFNFVVDDLDGAQGAQDGLAGC